MNEIWNIEHHITTVFIDQMFFSERFAYDVSSSGKYNEVLKHSFISLMINPFLYFMKTLYIPKDLFFCILAGSW